MINDSKYKFAEYLHFLPIIISVMLIICFVKIICIDGWSGGSSRPIYCPTDDEYDKIIWVSDYGFMASDGGNIEFYGTIEGDEESYPFYGYHLWNQGGKILKNILYYAHLLLFFLVRMVRYDNMNNLAVMVCVLQKLPINGMIK